jgi:branched-chain amino acid transport system substrate-binding protein
MMPVKRTILSTFLALPLALASASSWADGTGVTDTSVKIGILTSITGPAAPLGNLPGAQLAFEEVNQAGGVLGRKIEPVIVDDETSASKGIAGFNKLVQSEKVFAVFGPSSSAVGVPMKGLMTSSGVPVIIPSFSSPDMTEPLIKNVFRTGTLNDRMQGRAIANYLVQNLKFDRIAIMRQSDQYGATGAASVTTRLNELQKPPVAVEVFNASDTDLSAQVLRVRATNPQAVVVYGYPSASAIATRQLRELGVTADIIGSTATSSQNYPELVGKLGAGVKFAVQMPELPESKERRMTKFREAFQKRFPDLALQSRPNAVDALSYGGALNLVEGLRRSGKDLTREKFMAAMETLDGFDVGVMNPTYLSATRHEGNTRMGIAVINPDLTRKILPGDIDAQ